MSHIISLEAQDILRLKAVNIHADGKPVILSGDNAQGKSSVLNAILMALVGAKGFDRPVRDGAADGHVVIDLGDLMVSREVGSDGTSHLVVRAKDGDKPGAKLAKPQEILNRLAGRMVDPMAFLVMKPADQMETLRRLLGLDFTAVDKDIEKVEDERKALARDGKTLVAQADGMPDHRDVPDAEITLTAESKALEEAVAANAANDAERAAAKRAVDDLARQRAAVADAERAVSDQEGQIAAIRRQIEEANARLKTAERDLDGRKARVVAAKGDESKIAGAVDLAKLKVEALRDVDTKPIKDRIATAEDINRKVRENAVKRAKMAEIVSKRTEHKLLTDRLETLRQKKRDAIAAAPFPIAGLSFDDSGVLWNGIPFSQASTAERARVSVAMAMALAGDLKVLLVRDASLLDEKTMAEVCGMAADKGFQLWTEVVGKRPGTVVIEDGGVVGGAP